MTFDLIFVEINAQSAQGEKTHYPQPLEMNNSVNRW
jgi:hypothetical protein